MRTNRRFITVFILYTAFLCFQTFGSSILPAHFLAQHFTFIQMMSARIILFAAQIAALLLMARLSAKLAWRLALILLLAYVLLSVKILGSAQFYLAHVLNGVSLALFFIFYNIAHFENTPKPKTGLSAASMFSIGVIISIFAAPISGYVASVSLNYFWIITLILFLIAFATINGQSDFKLNYNLRASLKAMKSTRALIFIEGVWEAIPLGIIPIYTLFFIRTPLYYGAYLGYLSLVAIVANLLLGRVTDKLQKRVTFLYPLTITMSVFTFLLIAGAKDVAAWIAITGLIQFLLPLFWNISTAMVVDQHLDLRMAIPGRELLLASGRLLGLILVTVSFLVESKPKYIFLVLGCAILIYPLVLFWNARITRRHQYL